MSKKKRITRKDVAYAYLTGGVPAVEKLDASRGVLRLALKLLREDKKDYTALEQWCIEKFGLAISSAGKNGRSYPVAGEKRVYKAQKYQEGAPFAKVPLSPLGIKKGDAVVTTFGPDRIVIERASAP